jgi:hypothetical protein
MIAMQPKFRPGSGCGQSLANLNLEKPGELTQPVANPILPVAKITPWVRVGTAEERSSNTSSDAVVNADTVFIDNVAVRIGWHGVLRVQVDAGSELLVFATTVVDRMP